MSLEFSFLEKDQRFTTGFFIRRQNRFIIECKIGDEITFAHLPNPGRLWELLLPGSKLLLLKSRHNERKYDYTCYGVFRDDKPVLLHTSKNNDVAQWIIESELLDPLADYKIHSREKGINNSRIDFLLSNKSKELYLEVKSCTLFCDKLAMFPDAITDRGTRHLIELAELRSNKTQGGVLFLVQNGDVKYFLPEYHTDLKFARTLYTLRNEIKIFSVGISWNKNLIIKPTDVKLLTIPFEIISKEAEDKGVYILIIKNEEDKEIQIGNLGKVKFQKGYYCYVGSAMKNLSQRIARHRRKNKNLHWHIDYLLQNSKILKSIEIRTIDKIECDVSYHLDKIAETRIDKFGSSDCNCNSHLFFFNEDPLSTKQFINVILYFRMGRLIEKYKLK